MRRGVLYRQTDRKGHGPERVGSGNIVAVRRVYFHFRRRVTELFTKDIRNQSLIAMIEGLIRIVIFLLWKRVSLVSILTSIIYLISTYIAWMLGFVDVYQLFFVFPVVALLLLRHKDNIKRLLRGEEKAITPDDRH